MEFQLREGLSTADTVNGEKIGLLHLVLGGLEHFFAG